MNIKIQSISMPSTSSNKHVAFPPTLVLGASGRLGRLLQNFWIDKPVTWASRRGIDNTVQIDPLADFRALAASAHDHSCIFGLSGVVPGKGDLSLNTSIAQSAIRAAAAAGDRSVFLCSSAAVYGRGDSVWTEDATPLPESPYGNAKFEMEQRALELADKLSVKVCCLRIANVAGADAILGGWKPGFSLDQFENGTTPLRSYIGPGQFADVLAQLISQSKVLPRILNVCLPAPVYMGDLLDAVERPWQPQIAGTGAIPSVVLSAENLARFTSVAAMGDTAPDIVADWLAWTRRRTVA